MHTTAVRKSWLDQPEVPAQLLYGEAPDTGSRSSDLKLWDSEAKGGQTHALPGASCCHSAAVGACGISKGLQGKTLSPAS